MEVLKKYIPENSYTLLDPLLLRSDTKLTITKPRSTKLGDYRPPYGKNTYHRISVNGNLNPYAFLITLVHEWAHLLVFEQYKNKVKPHGKQWKNMFSTLLEPFIFFNVFPEDVKLSLYSYCENPAASSCSDANLMRALRKYDNNPINELFLEELEENEIFTLNKTRLFKKGPKQRTRFKCQDLQNKRYYLVNGLAPVVRYREDN